MISSDKVGKCRHAVRTKRLASHWSWRASPREVIREDGIKIGFYGEFIKHY